MRVAIVSIGSSVNGRRSGEGGLAWYTLNLARRLAARGLTVHVLANIAAARIDEPNYKVIPVWRANDPFMSRALKRSLNDFAPDLLHVQHELFLYGGPLSASLFPTWLRRLSRIYPTVTTVHGVLASDELDNAMARSRGMSVPLPIVRTAVSNIFRRIAQSPGDIIVHEETFLRRLVNYGAAPPRIHVIPIPSELEGFVTTRTRSEARRILGIEENERVALTWGFDNAYKGTDLLAAGFSIYRKRDARARLILGVGPHPKLGSSQYGSDYNQRFEEIGRADGVNSVGFIPFDQLETYTVAADVVVFPYRKYLAASGPMAITLGLGRPILASNVFQDIPAILRFEPSPAGIADALEAFFADPTSVSEASLALAEARSPEHVTDLHVAAYLATVERNA